jgi:RTX calcium-binding nonapeptide repeat (4 copies)
MRPLSFALAVAGACALVPFLASPASAVINPDQFTGVVSVSGSTLVLGDTTTGPGTSEADGNDGVHIRIGQLDTAFFGASITGFLDFHPDRLSAGPGCTLTGGGTGSNAVFSCASAGVTRLAYAPASPSTAPSAADLTPEGSLPITALLGDGGDRFKMRPDVDDAVDGGAGTDTLDTEAVPLSFTPLVVASVHYSDDGIANDGYVGRGAAQNFTGFENVSGATADDVLRGGSRDETLDGHGGADDIDGGPGDDTIVGGGGVDTVTGGAGDDRLMLRDGERDVIKCEPGTNTYDADLTDDLPTIEKCTASVSKGSTIAVQTSKLDTALKAGKLTALKTFSPPPPAAFGVGAVKEKPNVRVVGRLLVARRGIARLTLSCPKATTGGCSGGEELRDLRGKRIVKGPAHRIRAGKRAAVKLKLPRSQRPGARLVDVRIVEKGKIGPKTSGGVLTLAVV